MKYVWCGRVKLNKFKKVLKSTEFYTISNINTDGSYYSTNCVQIDLYEHSWQDGQVSD